jgi:hypothetical protein
VEHEEYYEECMKSINADKSLASLLPIRDPQGEGREISVETFCNIRASLFLDAGKVGNSKMTPLQVSTLKKLLSSEAGLKPQLSMDYLKACKLVLGRWLRPSEMLAVFGKAIKIFRQRFYLRKLAREDSNVHVGRAPSGEFNSRVSYLIGASGARLNGITRKSGALYIWLGPPGKRAVLSVYAKAPSTEGARGIIEKAARMINGALRAFEGKTPGQAKGFRLASADNMPDMRMQLVPLLQMYEELLSSGK